MAYTFLGLNINDKIQIISHIDNNKLNNNITNFKVVTHQENEFNINSEGYVLDKLTNKFQTKFMLNDKMINLGVFSTELEAKAAYNSAKLIHHKFN